MGKVEVELGPPLLYTQPCWSGWKVQRWSEPRWSCKSHICNHLISNIHWCCIIKHIYVRLVGSSLHTEIIAMFTWSPGHLLTWPPAHLATFTHLATCLPGHLLTWPPAHLAMSLMISSVNTLGTPAAPIRTVGLRFISVFFSFWFWQILITMTTIIFIKIVILQLLDDVSQLVDLSVLVRKWSLVLGDPSLNRDF